MFHVPFCDAIKAPRFGTHNRLSNQTIFAALGSAAYITPGGSLAQMCCAGKDVITGSEGDECLVRHAVKACRVLGVIFLSLRLQVGVNGYG